MPVPLKVSVGKPSQKLLVGIPRFFATHGDRKSHGNIHGFLWFSTGYYGIPIEVEKTVDSMGIFEGYRNEIFTGHLPRDAQTTVSKH